MRLDPKRSDAKFYYYYFSSPAGRSTVSTIVSGTNVKGIRGTELRELKIPCPAKAEQKAVADTLSDADAFIESLEKLLAKKRDIKQGAMQELLTGKRRLPGFSGEWIAKKLGNTATLKARIGWQGLTTAEYLQSGPYYLVTGTEFRNGYVDWDNCCYVEESRYKQDRNIQLRKRDVLVTKDGTIGKIALVTELPRPAARAGGNRHSRPVIIAT